MIRGTLSQAAAYPDAVLASIAEFLSAHSALLNQYLTAVAPGPNTGSSTPATAGADP